MTLVDPSSTLFANSLESTCDLIGIRRDVAKQGYQMEETLKLFEEKHLAITNDIRLETAGIQKTLDKNCTELEGVRTCADQLKQSQERLKLEVTRIDDKIDKFQANQNSLNLNFTDKSARTEQKLDMFLQQQNTINNQLNSTITPLQEKIGTLAERTAVIQEKQLSFIDDQKSLSEKYNNDKAKLELVNEMLDERSSGTAKKVEIIEHCMQDYRTELRQMSDMLKGLVAQVSEIEARTKTMEQPLQNTVNREDRNMNNTVQ